MARRDIPQQPYDQDSAWTIENRQVGGTEYLGTKDDGTPAYYDRNEHATFEGEIDRENERIRPTNERSLDPEETLGEALADLGDAVGWESLSAFAREHLGADDETNPDDEE